MATARASSSFISTAFPAWLLTALFRRRRRSRNVLDPNELSDHLKRDLGFLDASETLRRR